MANLLNKLGLGLTSLAIASGAALYYSNNVQAEGEQNYSISIPGVNSLIQPQMVTGDFNEDGHQDVLIGCSPTDPEWHMHSMHYKLPNGKGDFNAYLFLGNGKGDFKLSTRKAEAEK